MLGMKEKILKLQKKRQKKNNTAQIFSTASNGCTYSGISVKCS